MALTYFSVTALSLVCPLLWLDWPKLPLDHYDLGDFDLTTCFELRYGKANKFVKLIRTLKTAFANGDRLGMLLISYITSVFHFFLALIH